MAHALTDESGNIEFVGAVMDVTAAKEAEDKVRLIINAVPAFIWTAAPDGRLDFIGQRWVDYVGMTLEQILAQGTGSHCHPDDADQFRSKWRAAVAGGQPFEIEARVRRFDGEYRWLLSRGLPLLDRSGHDRKQAEEKLQRSPNLNAYAERFVRSINEECLDRMIFVGQASLRRAVTEFVVHYHSERNHQGLGNRLLQPEQRSFTASTSVCRHERLGGMLSFYYPAAV